MEANLPESERHPTLLIAHVTFKVTKFSFCILLNLTWTLDGRNCTLSDYQNWLRSVQWRSVHGIVHRNDFPRNINACC